MGQKVRVWGSQHTCDALGKGLTIVCLRCSAYIDLTKRGPYAYQPLQMGAYPGQLQLMFPWFGEFWLYTKALLIMCQLTFLPWLPWNLFCKVPKVFNYLRSLRLDLNNIFKRKWQNKFCCFLCSRCFTSLIVRFLTTLSYKKSYPHFRELESILEYVK